MMITLGNNKAMKTFQRPTMFESFSELEHNRIDSENDDQYTVVTGVDQQQQLNTQQTINQQNLQTVQSKVKLAGNQKSSFRPVGGSRVKVRTTLISISPSTSPTNQLSDTSVNLNNHSNLTNGTTLATTINNNVNNTSINSSIKKGEQLINYISPNQKINKKNLVRCESVDSINQMNGYSSVSSCSTVVNRPNVQKMNWNVCASNNNCNKIVKYHLEDQQQNDKKYYNNSLVTIKQSKTVDNISSFMQPQQQHQTCPQFREQMQNKFTTNQQRTNNKIIIKSKEQDINQQTAQIKNLSSSINSNSSNVSNGSNNNSNNSSNNQQQDQHKQQQANRTVNLVRTTNANSSYQLPQLTTQPLIAIRRILLLYENLQYKETAQFISRLQNACFQLILRDLPIGLFIEQMPQSLVVLEALYAKLYASLQELDCLYSNGALIVSSTQLAVLPELNPNQTVNHTIGRNLLKLLQPESVTMHLVKMFALKSHAHHSIYDCTTSPSNSHSHSNISSGGVFALMQERFDNSHPVMITMRKLLNTILTIQPPISKQLAARKRAIDAAIDALGHHGLVSTGNNLSNSSNLSSSSSSSSSSSTSSTGSNATSASSPVNGCTNSLDGNSVLMMSLHEALKLEFDFVIQQYKQAVQKLDEAISSSNTSTTGKQLTPMKFTLRNLSKIPSSASHQRQLSLRPDEIQLRLMRNKSLLNSLEQFVLNQHSVQILMGILEQRINYDKETLFQFTQLRKEFNYCCSLSQQLASSFGGGTASHGHTTREPNATIISGCVHNGEMNCCIDANAVVAPVLMRFSFGCGQVLRVFEELAVEMAVQAEEAKKAESEEAETNNDLEKAETKNETVDNTTYCTQSTENNSSTKLKDLNEIDKQTVINNQIANTNYKDKTHDNQDQLNEKVKRVDDNEETRQSSSDISGYHSDENTDYLLNGSIQSGQQNSGCLDGKRISSQSSHFFSRGSSSSPLSSASYSSCSSDLRNDDLSKKANSLDISSNNQHHDLTNVETPISYLDNEQNETCWTPQQSRYTDNELIILKRELIRSKQTIFELQEREQQLLIKLKQKQTATPPQDLLTDNNSIPKLIPEALTPIPFSPEKRRPCALIRKFGDLYSQARVDTLDSLDLIEQLKDADELKAKLLFSVVVLSFRSVQKTITDIKQKICTLLQVYDCDQPNQSTIKQLETAINAYFKANVDTFDTSKNSEEVCNQIWTTLYDYPCLKESSGLNNYINDCVKLAYALSVQTPAYLIRFDSKLFDPDQHVRFHISDSTSSQIKNYLWPALIEETEEGENGVCVHKAVVVT